MQHLVVPRLCSTKKRSMPPLPLPPASDRNGLHLTHSPVAAHVICTKRMHFLVEVLEEDGAPGVHLLLHDAQLQLALAVAASAEVGLEDVHALVDLAVLAEQLGSRVRVLSPGAGGGLELGHLARQDGEQVRLLDVVVGGQVAREVEACPRSASLRQVV
jgi:hypothetical protein